MSSEPVEWKHGWWSAEMDKVSGSAFYENKEGKLVAVTWVTSERIAPSSPVDDLKYVGRVGRFVDDSLEY